jgi:hypothetical protein
MSESLKMPPGYQFTGTVQHHDGEDCMGRPYSHFSMKIEKPGGGIITGYGIVPSEARDKALALAVEDAAYRAMTPKARLTKIMSDATARGRFYDAELLEAMSIIAAKLDDGGE